MGAKCALGGPWHVQGWPGGHEGVLGTAQPVLEITGWEGTGDPGQEPFAGASCHPVSAPASAVLRGSPCPGLAGVCRQTAFETSV